MQALLNASYASISDFMEKPLRSHGFSVFFLIFSDKPLVGAALHAAQTAPHKIREKLHFSGIRIFNFIGLYPGLRGIECLLGYDRRDLHADPLRAILVHFRSVFGSPQRAALGFLMETFIEIFNA